MSLSVHRYYFNSYLFFFFFCALTTENIQVRKVKKYHWEFISINTFNKLHFPDITEAARVAMVTAHRPFWPERKVSDFLALALTFLLNELYNFDRQIQLYLRTYLWGRVWRPKSYKSKHIFPCETDKHRDMLVNCFLFFLYHIAMCSRKYFTVESL